MFKGHTLSFTMGLVTSIILLSMLFSGCASSGFTIPLTVEFVAEGFEKPLFITTHPGDNERLFIVEQTGKIRIIKNGVIISEPFLDIGGLIASGANEQGLLGLAFHPAYQSNGFFFVNYTRSSDGATVVARYTVSSNPDLAGNLYFCRFYKCSDLGITYRWRSNN